MLIINFLILLYLIIGTLIICWGFTALTKEERSRMMVITWIFSIIMWLPMLLKIFKNWGDK